MTVITTANHAKNRIVYHKSGCIYEKRISLINRQYRNLYKVEASRRFCECTYCGGMAGDVRIYRKDMESRCKKTNAEMTFDKRTETLYIKTEIGFWKIFVKPEDGRYLLYHRNEFNGALSFNELSMGEYHRQSDVKAGSSIMKIFNYVLEHDKAKIIMLDDYKKLPRNSNQQKKYYKQADRKAKRKQVRDVFALFDQLEKNDPALKEFSYC